MKNSPFVYGSTVSRHAFTDRQVERKKLRTNLLSGINTTIISPRRWGKSSLVEKVIAEINQVEPKVKTVVIDIFSTGSEAEFLEMLAREVIKSSSGKWQEWLEECRTFFKKIVPRFSVGMDPANDFSLSFEWEDLQKHPEEVLNLAETIAEKKGIKFIICLDEFQSLSAFENYPIFEKRLRSFWQRHKHVTYCLYGSKRHMMTDIFNNPSKPFYRFGDILLLGKIDRSEWVKFIQQGFKSGGKFIDSATAGLIPQTMQDHSWYVQQLAHYTWNLTREKATVKEVDMALEELIRANTPLYQRELEALSGTQLNLLKAVSRGETMFTSQRVMEKYALGTPRNVSKNKTRLYHHDLIDLHDGIAEFLDPAMLLWFNKQFFSESYLR